MSRIDRNELHRCYEKYVKENNKIDEMFFGELSENIKDKKYLTPLELISIVYWKIGYYLPIRRYIDTMAEKGSAQVKVCSEDAFKLYDKGRIEEALQAFAGLLDIKGKTITIASAILAFYDYPNFPVIDRHSWLALYNEEKAEFYAEDYTEFLKDVKKLAEDCHLSPRAIECSLYQMGRDKSYNMTEKIANP